AASRHWVDGGGQRLPVAPRVHVWPAGQHDAGELVEDRVDLGQAVLAQGRQEHGHCPGGGGGIEITGVEAEERGRVLRGGVVRVHPDERATGRRGGFLVLRAGGHERWSLRGPGRGASYPAG